MIANPKATAIARVPFGTEALTPPMSRPVVPSGTAAPLVPSGAIGPLDYLAWTLRDARVIELRAQTPEGYWRTGYFDNAVEATRVASGLSSTGCNVYSTFNRPKFSGHCTAPNAMCGRALGNSDISHRTRLVFDFDPVRPTGTPSTDAELAAAIEVRNRVAGALRSVGWPEPARAISGNGAHLIYRCVVPVTVETDEQIRAVYAGLYGDFLDEADGTVIFDRSVRNAARIWRVYGYRNIKGQASDERPHRFASIEFPPELRPLDPRDLARLANAYARRASGAGTRHEHHDHARVPRPADGRRGDFSTLDVAAWFAAHGALRRQLAPDRYAVICPWTDEHSTQGGELDTSTVIWTAHAPVWPRFHCSHAHCEGRDIRDVLALWADADSYCAQAFEPAPARGRP